jgi:hypothetical protein
MVSDCNATALFGDVIPDIIEVGCRLLRYAVRHQRGEDCSAARRTWPRYFTSSARSRIDSCVMLRPSPRAREPLALIEGCQEFRSLALALFPQQQCLLYRILGTVKPAGLDGLASECLLVGRQTYFHAPKLKRLRSKCQAFPAEKRRAPIET